MMMKNWIASITFLAWALAMCVSVNAGGLRRRRSLALKGRALAMSLETIASDDLDRESEQVYKLSSGKKQHSGGGEKTKQVSRSADEGESRASGDSKAKKNSGGSAKGDSARSQGGKGRSAKGGSGDSRSDDSKAQKQSGRSGSGSGSEASAKGDSSRSGSQERPRRLGQEVETLIGQVVSPPSTPEKPRPKRLRVQGLNHPTTKQAGPPRPTRTRENLVEVSLLTGTLIGQLKHQAGRVCT